MEVAVLIAAFSEKDTVFACLRNLYGQVDAMKAEGIYNFTIYLVANEFKEDLHEAFPDVIPIITDTTHYNQAMRLAWERAATKNYDFYLWLYDKLQLKEGALATMMETSKFFGHKSIVAGSCMDSEKVLSYGGRNKSGKIITPDATIPVPCHTFDGAMVLVPKAVYNVLGNFDAHYESWFGDMDYGIRAYKEGIPRVVAPEILGVCDRPFKVPAWRDSKLTLSQRFAALTSPDGPPPTEQFRYDCRSVGPFKAINHQISIFFKVLFARK